MTIEDFQSVYANRWFNLKEIHTDCDGNPTALVYTNDRSLSGRFEISIKEAKQLIDILSKDIERVEKQFDKLLNPVFEEEDQNA